MSSLEDLRRYAEEARLLAQQEAERKKQGREYHDQRKQQAEAFWKESGAEDLVGEIKDLLKTTGRLLQFVRTTSDIEEEKRVRLDTDSKLEFLDWDEIADGTYRKELSSGSWGSSGYEYNSYKRNHGSIEALPDGDIVFRGKQTTRVLLTQWRISGDLITSAMDTFLNNPEIRKYYTGSGRSYHESYGSGYISTGKPWE